MCRKESSVPQASATKGIREEIEAMKEDGQHYLVVFFLSTLSSRCRLTLVFSLFIAVCVNPG